MELTELSAKNFRNLELSAIAVGGSGNAILGANGVGKTSFLEALVVLTNLRSFRAASIRRTLLHGEKRFLLTGSVRSGDRYRKLEHELDVGPPIRRILRIDGQTVTVRSYLQICPVTAITVADRELVGGGPETRRALLDRFTFLIEPSFFDDLRNYRKALRQRNAALGAAVGDEEIAAWENPLSKAAARVTMARAAAAEILARHFKEVYSELGGGVAPELSVDYRAEPWWEPGLGLEKVEDLYQQRYNETRVRDRQTGFTMDGPHRHDVSLRSGGRSARYLLSSGQVKVVAAALRLATLAHVEKERSENFPVVVDDVDAELDRGALDRLLGYLGTERQLFLSSTSDGVAEAAGPRTRRLWLENGRCVRQEAESDE